ncbi:hypothetical protein BH24ACT15_BH24ACT15_26300 [soil metagenome]
MLAGSVTTRAVSDCRAIRSRTCCSRAVNSSVETPLRKLSGDVFGTW